MALTKGAVSLWVQVAVFLSARRAAQQALVEMLSAWIMRGPGWGELAQALGALAGVARS